MTDIYTRKPTARDSGFYREQYERPITVDMLGDDPLLCSLRLEFKRPRFDIAPELSRSKQHARQSQT